jgi:hypothetical protein
LFSRSSVGVALVSFTTVGSGAGVDVQAGIRHSARMAASMVLHLAAV